MELLRVSRRGHPYQVLAMCDERGSCQILDFLLDLGSERNPLRRKILALLQDRVPQRGVLKNDQESKELEDGIFEFRPFPARILWFWDENQVVICVEALSKPKKRATQREIAKAKDARSAYRLAKSHNDIQITNMEIRQ